MTLGEAVNFYHSLEKFGIMPGLERIKLLCERLGSPQKNLKFIHVAGTNGKGSTCTCIASVLTEAGFRTGLYTSPYVIEFRERIRLNMEMIPPVRLCEVTQRVKAEIEKLTEEGIRITEFEAVTAAAFLFYCEEKCDYVVLETGLGGRFDATNVIEAPLVSIITSVSEDHIAILGNTLSQIAFEKCGIIKKGCPVITSALQKKEVLEVIREQASKNDAALLETDHGKVFDVLSEDISGTYVFSPEGKLRISLGGSHQLENAALAWQALNIIRIKGAALSSEAFYKGFANARIPARTEIICESPLVILDGSHNDGSTAALAAFVEKHLKGKKLLALMGMMADKDCEKSLSNILPLFSEVITVRPSNPRAMAAGELAGIACKYTQKVRYCDSPLCGVETAFEVLQEYDGLIVCGSLYLAGDVRDLLIKKNDSIKQNTSEEEF